MDVSEGFDTADVETRVRFIKPGLFHYDINRTNNNDYDDDTALLVRVKVVGLLSICHPCLECMLRQIILGLHHTLRRNMVCPLPNASKKYIC